MEGNTYSYEGEFVNDHKSGYGIENDNGTTYEG